MPENTLNARVAAMRPSATMAMSARADRMQRDGHPVINLSAGEPDFDTPSPIAEAGLRAIREGFTKYTPNAGMPELREAICEKLRRENGLAYEAEQILCSNGAKQSVALGVHVVCDAGDEVLIPAPHWVSYPEMTRFAGATPIVLPTRPEDAYRLTPRALEEAITPQTRLLVLCTPSNPTGTVYSRADLNALAEVLRAHPRVYVLSDEIYEHIRFAGDHVSLATLNGLQDRTITVNGFSKAYAMTGWRLGYLAAPSHVVEAAAKVQSQFTSAPSSIAQRAGLAALSMDPAPVRAMVHAFRKRRDLVVAFMDRLEVRCPTPAGAFYAFPDVSAYFGRAAPDGRLIETSEDLCVYLLETAHVALVLGRAFGAPAGLRLAYTAPADVLREALQRLGRSLEALT